MKISVSPGDKFADYLLEVSKGNVAGHRSIHNFGNNADIDTASGFEDVWDNGGTYIPPTSPQLHDVVSTSVLDIGALISSGTVDTVTADPRFLIDMTATFITDGVAVEDTVLNDTGLEIGGVSVVLSETTLIIGGFFREPESGFIGVGPVIGDAYRVINDTGTGASTMYIDGIDETALQAREFLIMNGTTIVPTVTTYRRINVCRVFGDVGTSAVGTISLTAVTDLTLTCQILAGNHQSLMAIYSIPLNQNGFIHQWWGSLSKKQTGLSSLVLNGGNKLGFGYILQARTLSSSGSSEFSYIPSTPLQVGPGLDLWVEADSSVNDMGIASGFDMILVDL